LEFEGIRNCGVMRGTNVKHGDVRGVCHYEILGFGLVDLRVLLRRKRRNRNNYRGEGWRRGDVCHYSHRHPREISENPAIHPISISKKWM